MDLAVILTYRCTARCSMCHVWKHPTRTEAEVTLETLAKVPSGFDFINLSGGEPTLRRDLPEIAPRSAPTTWISTRQVSGTSTKYYRDLSVVCGGS